MSDFDFNGILRDAVNDPVVQKPIKSHKPGSGWAPPSLPDIQAKIAAENAARNLAQKVFQDAQRHAEHMESLAWQNHRKETALRRQRHIKPQRNYDFFYFLAFIGMIALCIWAMSLIAMAQ